MTEELLKTVLSQGLLGVITVVLAYSVFTKDKAVQAEKDARIADAKAYTDMALNLQKQVLSAVDKLSDIVDLLNRGPKP